ncbi:MAG: hypothetical protein FJ291_23385 [Planctomycetes bacterium]|nr:hypothetical protein [Planctomycetota bacterium]
MDVTFLVGAGGSAAVCMPSTSNITYAVLNSENFLRHTGGSVLFDRDRTIKEDGPVNWRAEYRRHVEPWQRLLRSVRDTMKALVPNSEPSYEELYYVAEALWRDLLAAERDALAEAFWRFLEPSIPTDLKPTVDHKRRTGGWLAQDPLLNPEEYVRGAVAAYLNYHQRKVRDTSNLRLFGHAANHARKVHIFTLNHDTLIECHLDS